LIPTCQNVINDGRTYAGDISGPAGVPDCKVDMYDFAAMAVSWLVCNDPDNSNCAFPY
jgi:hypothetical protein